MVEFTAPEYAVDGLIEYLRQQMPELKHIIDEFPDANVTLEYPSLTVSHSVTDSAFSNLAPYEFARSATDANHKTRVQYVVGQWDFQVQCDFWARNKPERDRLFKHFFDVFNAVIDPMGLSLELTRYYNLWSRYDLSGFKHFDDGENGQRGIWRTMVNVLVNVKEIREKTEYVMQTIENDLTLLDINQDVVNP